MTTVAERVAAGAEWLDGNTPGWVERIDLNKLDLGDCENCVLGQLFGYFYEAPHEARGLLSVVAIQRGFERAAGGGGYRELTEEWRRVITARREAAVVPS